MGMYGASDLRGASLMGTLEIVQPCSAEALNTLGDVAVAVSPGKPLIVSFFTFKGGVGKTTLCNLLAYTLAKSGFDILLIDADRQCNLTLHFQDNPKIYGEDSAEDQDVSSHKSSIMQLDISRHYPKSSSTLVCLNLLFSKSVVCSRYSRARLQLVENTCRAFGIHCMQAGLLVCVYTSFVTPHMCAC